MKKITYKNTLDALSRAGLEWKTTAETDETYGVIKFLLSDRIEFTLVFDNEILVDQYCKSI